MSMSSWRMIALVASAACVWLVWRGSGRNMTAPPTADACAELAAQPGQRRDSHRYSKDQQLAAEKHGDEPSVGGSEGFGFGLPAWVRWLAPHPDEDMLSYRDRLVPLAQAAVAPHRARVARSHTDFAALAGLDARQKAELDAAVQEAGTAIQDSVLQAALSGELSPSTFKPTTGVALARDVLDQVDRANQRFLLSLRDDQRATLSNHSFDLADYLLFSTRWEDAIGATR